MTCLCNYVTDGWMGWINKQRGVREVMQSTDNQRCDGTVKTSRQHVKRERQEERLTAAFINFLL